MRSNGCIERLVSEGISRIDAIALRRISMILHRWFEKECGDSDDFKSECLVRGFLKKDRSFDYNDDGDPYREIHWHHGKGAQYLKTPDFERGAKKRLAMIMTRYPTMEVYIQTDPRGASLYILNKDDVAGKDISTCYNRGIAVYK